MAESALLHLEIHDVAFGGKGVARHDGKVYFVPFTIPGETVTARVVRLTTLTLYVAIWCSSEAVVWAWANVDAPKTARTAKSAAELFTVCLLEKL